MRFINFGLKIRQTALQQLPDFCGPVPKGRGSFPGIYRLSLTYDFYQGSSPGGQNDYARGTSRNADFILIAR